MIFRCGMVNDCIEFGKQASVFTIPFIASPFCVELTTAVAFTAAG
jgi:hypothetical protein